MCIAVAHMQNVCACMCVCVHGFVGGELDSGQAVRTETCTSSTSLSCPCLSSAIVTAVSSSRCDRLPLRNDSDIARCVWMERAKRCPKRVRAVLAAGGLARTICKVAPARLAIITRNIISYNI